MAAPLDRERAEEITLFLLVKDLTADVPAEQNATGFLYGRHYFNYFRYILYCPDNQLVITIFNKVFVPAELTITLMDVNDNPPQFIPSDVYHARISEASHSGTEVKQVQAVDADKTHGKIAYYMVRRLMIMTIC